MKKLSTIFTILILISFASQKILAWTNYVSAAGSETAPYDTWAKAAKSIQPAVDYAVEGNVVLVADGTYTVSSQILIITNNIILKSENGAGNVSIDGNSTTHPIYLRGNSVIDGFSIINGIFPNGGGIFVHQNGGTILNCIFTNNFATSSDGGAIRARGSLVSNCYFYANGAENGGAVFMYYNSIVKDCIFINNLATNGGAIHCDGVDAGTVSDCVISNNNAKEGGGVFCNEINPVITNCSIIGNAALWGAGTLDGTINNCTIIGNSAKYGGGGTRVGTVNNCTISGNSSGQSGGGTHVTTVNNSTISGNYAGNSGGGVYNSTVNNSTISGNYAGGDGGGTFNATINNSTISGNSANSGGGALCSYGVALTNCLISGLNSAKYGGGVYCFDGGELINCTIVGNSATDSGGGIDCYGLGGIGNITIINTIIYDNQAAFSNDNWQASGPNNAFGYSCTFPLTGLPIGNQCISNDPKFITPGSDYHLQETSPCRNSGSNMVWMIGATDLDGNPRLTGGTVDMGCYEVIPEPGFYLLFIIYQLLFINRRMKFNSMN